MRWTQKNLYLASIKYDNQRVSKVENGIHNFFYTYRFLNTNTYVRMHLHLDEFEKFYQQKNQRRFQWVNKIRPGEHGGLDNISEKNTLKIKSVQCLYTSDGENEYSLNVP